MNGLIDLIARSPEASTASHGLTPNELAELIFAVARGMLMRDILRPPEMTAAERRTRQLEVTRRLWRLLFKPEGEASLCMTLRNLIAVFKDEIQTQTALSLAIRRA